MKNLTELDILDLITETNIELKKQSYKTEKLQELLKKLEASLHEKKEEEEEKRKQVLVRSYNHTGTKDQDTGTKRKPYPLSDWDKAIISTLEDHGRIMVSSELLESVIHIAKENGFYNDDNHAKIKLNQCLVKLANRRGDIIKLHHRGRGFAYALPEWLDGDQLRKEYQF